MLPGRPHVRPIIVAGHVCLDIIPDFENALIPSPGALAEIGPATFGCGGVVANVGKTLCALGSPIRAFGLTGKDEMARILRNHLPATAELHLRELDSSVTSYSIVLSPRGTDRSFLHCSGANRDFSPAMVPDSLFAGAGALHFGYPPLMRQTFIDGGHALAEMFRRARAAGLRTSLDMSWIDASGEAAAVDWPAWFETVLPEVDLFAPSLPELCDGMRAQVPTNANGLQNLAERVLSFGCGIIAIKLGEDGLLLAGSSDSSRIAAARLPPPFTEALWVEPCYAVDVVNTTGAGDATAAGLVSALEFGFSPEESARFATAVGALQCAVPAGTAIQQSTVEIIEKLGRPWPKRPSRFISRHV